MHNIHQLSLIGLMSAVLCILSPFSLVLPFSPVPLSLSTLAIYFTIMILGYKQGTISVIIYILLGLTGLPIFSGFTGGIGKLLGPTGGYIIGYIPLALICGFFLSKWKNNKALSFAGVFLGTLVCYAIGTLWLSLQTSLTLPAAIMSGIVPYIPGDLLKITVAFLIGRPISKRLQRAGLVPNVFSVGQCIRHSHLPGIPWLRRLGDARNCVVTNVCVSHMRSMGV